jgi:hypothetical protein
MDETIRSEDLFKGDVTEEEYTKFYNIYCMAVFEPCIQKDINGEYIKDESGKYVLTEYGKVFPTSNRERSDRPISRDKTIGLDKNRAG